MVPLAVLIDYFFFLDRIEKTKKSLFNSNFHLN